MRQMEIRTTVKVCNIQELTECERRLVDVAREATKRSYAPYSKFNVGAAVLLADGTIVSGNNQENAAYPSGLCAERTALFWANAQYPNIAVDALAVAACNEQGEMERPISPCGSCRQVILEVEKRFGRPVRIILVGKKDIYIVEQGITALLPLCFDSDYL